MASVTYNVEMVCDGCSGAVTRILSKVEGVTDVQIDMEGQKVTVCGEGLDANGMFEKLQKWGTAAQKKVSLA